MKYLNISLIFILGFSHLSSTQAQDASFHTDSLPSNILLQSGIKFGSLEAVRVALDRGAHPSGNMSELFRHYVHSSVDIPEDLREYGLLREPLLSYAIMRSPAKGDLSIANELIFAGADVNATNIYGVTPLNRAMSLYLKVTVESHLFDLMNRLNSASAGSTPPLILRSDEIKREPLPRISITQTQVNALIEKLK